jgi:hypothetical protein
MAEGRNHLRLVKGVIDETQEPITVGIPKNQGKRKARKAKRMSMVNIDAMTRLEMTQTETRVFWNLVSHVPARSGSVAYVQIGQIAKELGIHRVEVSKTMKALRDRRIVTTLTQGQHHINANIVFSGSFDDWNEADVEELEPVWARHGVNPHTGEVL